MMDEATVRHIQMEGADALLDAGVVVPLLRLRLPFRKKPVEICLTMKRPCLSGQILIARTYLSMGVTSDEMWSFTKEQEMEFLAKHGNAVSRMIAYTVCRSLFARKLLLRPTAWVIRNFMRNDYLLGAMKRFVSLMGTDPFIPIIKSAERTNPLKPRTSQKERGS
jgi:hypothetical protein|nr:MAG TPA: hypothetical protein [Caudoviricetes sp.]